MIRLLISIVLIQGIHFNNSLPTISIISVDRFIESKMRVDCAYFESRFNKEKKSVRLIKSKKDIEYLLTELKNLPRLSTVEEIDTRAQILIQYSDHIDIVCVDRFLVYQNGIAYRINQSLTNCIWP